MVIEFHELKVVPYSMTGLNMIVYVILPPILEPLVALQCLGLLKVYHHPSHGMCNAF